MTPHDQISVGDAYIAMCLFLERYNSLAKNDELGGLLGAMSLLEDGQPADPALWEDWIGAIANAKSGKGDVQLRLRRENKP